MIETRNSEINVEELKARIRLAVDRRQAEGRMSFAKASADLFDLLSKEDFSLDRWLGDVSAESTPAVTDLVMQPEFVPQEAGYHVNDLLKYHDYQFVWNAYLAVLKREPDEVGLYQHLDPLRSGRLSKLDILDYLRNSDEGERQGVPIEGLSSGAFVRRAYRLRFIGPLFELVGAAVRLPSIIHRQRQFEVYLIAQQARIADHVNDTNRELLAQLSNQAESLESLKRALAELAKDQKQIARLQHQELASMLNRQPANGQPQSSEDQEREIDALYASFQTRIRGDQPAIRENLKAYLPLLEEAGVDSDILDVGCGGGEWLELLQESGLQARGVESNHALIAEARRRNVVVIEADATRYLRTLPDHSLRAVTAFHFVEHLGLYELVNFLKEVRRTLKPGGLVILETPNPKNLVVDACNFYSDPTHQRPLFPESLEFVVDYLGFERTAIRYLHPVEGSPFRNGDEGARALDSWFFSPTDYAVIAFTPQLK